MTDRKIGDFPFAAHGQKVAARDRRQMNLFIEGVRHHVRIGMIQHHHTGAAITQTLSKYLNQLDLAFQTGGLAGIARPGQDDDPLCAVAQGDGQEVEADLGDLVYREGQDMRRQSAAHPRHEGDHLLAMVGVMHQQNRRGAVGVTIGIQKQLHPVEKEVSGGQLVFRRAGRADTGATAAAGADMRINHNLVVAGGDGPGRADIQAPGAAGLLAASMHTYLWIVSYIPGLLELADQIGDVEQSLLNGSRVSGVGMEIAVPFFRRGHQCIAAREIEDQIKLQLDPVVGLAAGFERGPGRDLHRCVLIDNDVKIAQVSAEGFDRAGKDRNIHQPKRHSILRVFDQAGRIKPRGELLGDIQGVLPLAINKNRAFGDHGDAGGQRGIQSRFGQQRLDLGKRVLALFRPAGPFPDIGVGYFGVGINLGGALDKQRRFLSAGDDQRLVGRHHPAEIVQLGPAEMGVQLHVFFTEQAGQRFLVAGDGPFAIANEDILTVNFHVPVIRLFSPAGVPPRFGPAISRRLPYPPLLECPRFYSCDDCYSIS